MSGNFSVFNTMVDIIAAPAKAMDDVKGRKGSFWIPLLIIILLPIGVLSFYFTWVDFPWLVEETVRMTVSQAPDADTAAMMEQQIRSFMSPGVQIGITAAAVTIMTLLIFALQSGYLHLVHKVAGGDAELGYGDWFSFSTWTAFVGVFGSLAMLAAIFMADSNQLAQDALNPISMQSLFIHAEAGTPWFNWGNGLSLTNFWMLALMTIGIKRWTGAGTAKAVVIACAPWVAIFGIWALLIAL